MLKLDTIKIDVQDGIATVVMNNPPVNAFNRQLNDDLTTAFDWINDVPDLRVAILTGAGHVFCAGADIKARVGKPMGPGDLPAHSRRTRECFHAIRECAKPVIAAIQGPALGAGFVIAACCDILYAGENAVVALPEIDVGLLGGARHAMRIFGHSRARRMSLTCWRVPAQELYRQGAVEACLPTSELMPAVMEVARTIAAKSPIASRVAKQAFNVVEEMGIRDGYRYEQDMTISIAGTEDAREAQRAFAEKRPPVFKGR